MADPDNGVDIAAGIEVGFQLHPHRVCCSHQIIKDAIGDFLMGNRSIPETVHVKLDRLQFNDPGTGLIDQTQDSEIRITRKGALAGEFR